MTATSRKSPAIGEITGKLVPLAKRAVELGLSQGEVQDCLVVAWSQAGRQHTTVIESQQYEETRTTLAENPDIRAMADKLRPGLYTHEDGSPTHEFMISAMREFNNRQAARPPEERYRGPLHIGAAAEAILKLRTG